MPTQAINLGDKAEEQRQSIFVSVSEHSGSVWARLFVFYALRVTY